MIIKILLSLPGVVLGCMLGHWLFFVCNANFCGEANVVKLPFSTVKFLILNKPSGPASIEYDKSEINIKLYEKEEYGRFSSWHYYKSLYVKLSFIDWLKYRRFLKQYDKEKENRLEYENLQRVRDVIKAEQEKLEQAAERERKKALDILQGMAADKNDRLHETAKRLTGIKRPSGVFNEAIGTMLQRDAITPDEARELLNMEAYK